MLYKLKDYIKKLIPLTIRYSYFFDFLIGNLYYPYEHILKVSIEFIRSSKVSGDYLEFGSFVGSTMTCAFHLYSKCGLEAEFYAFDSFEGLPEPRGVDKTNQFTRGQFCCSEKEFLNRIFKRGVDTSKVKTIAGFYDKTLNSNTKKSLDIEKASIIYIDCDLYHSTVPVLDFITDYLQDGTILIFDDYFCFKGHPDKGQRKAVREWLEKNPSIIITEFHKFGWHGNSFIVNL